VKKASPSPVGKSSAWQLLAPCSKTRASSSWTTQLQRLIPGNRSGNPRSAGEPDENRTTFIIAHRIQSLMNADMILVMDKGRIVQSASMKICCLTEGTYRQDLRYPDQYRRRAGEGDRQCQINILKKEEFTNPVQRENISAVSWG
jgi:hypothetical protein